MLEFGNTLTELQRVWGTAFSLIKFAAGDTVAAIVELGKVTVVPLTQLAQLTEVCDIAGKADSNATSDNSQIQQV